MKKCFFALTLTALVSFTLVSCNRKDSSSNNPDSGTSPSEQFIDKWIYDDINIMRIREEAESYYWEYQELNDELNVAYRQADWEGIDKLKRQIDNLHEAYHDDYIGYCDVLDIGNGIVKIGRADIYFNPTSSSNCWFCDNAFHQFNMDMKVGFVVEDWRTYRYTIRDGVLYFDNGQECLFFAGSKLVWEGEIDFMSAFEFFQLVIE